MPPRLTVPPIFTDGRPLPPLPSFPEGNVRAYRLVVALDGEPLTGAQKRRKVIDALVPLADRAVSFGGPLGAVLELVDGVVIRLILRGIVEGALAAHRAAKPKQ